MAQSRRRKNAAMVGGCCQRKTWLKTGVFLVLLAEGGGRLDVDLSGTGEMPCLLLSVRRWKAKGRHTGSQRVAQVIMAVAMEDRVAVQNDGMCMARVPTRLV